MAVIGTAEVLVKPSTKGFAKEAEAGILGPLKGIATAAVGIFAAVKIGGAIVQGIQGTIERARIANKIVAQTEQVIKTTGNAAGITALQLQTLSNTIQAQTGVDEDLVTAYANVLLTFTNVKNQVGAGNDIFNQATVAILDMSKALKTDFQASAIQVGKALNDPIKGITALQRVGVSFTAQQKAQVKALVESGNVLEAQKIILRELNTEFGGTARALATPGELLSAQYKSLNDQLGARLIPILDRFENAILRVMPTVQKVTLAALDSITGAISRFVDATVKTLAPVVRSVAGAAEQLGDTIGGVVGRVRGFITEVARIATAAGVFSAFTTSVRSSFGGLGSTLLGTARTILGAVRQIGTQATVALRGVFGVQPGGGAQAAARALGVALGGLANVIAVVTRGYGLLRAAEGGALAVGLRNLGPIVFAVARAFGSLAEGVTAGVRSIAAGAGTVRSSLGGISTALGPGVQAVLGGFIVAVGATARGIEFLGRVAGATFALIGRVIGSTLAQVGPPLARVGASLSVLANSLRVALGTITEAFRSAGGPLAKFSDSVGTSLPALLTTVLVGAIDIAATAIAGLATGASAVVDLAAPKLAAFVGIITTWVADHGDEATRVFDAVGVALGKIRDGASDAAANVGPFLDKLSQNQGAVTAIAAGLSGLVTGLLAFRTVSQATASISAVSTALATLKAALAADSTALLAGGIIGIIVAVGVALFVAYQKIKPFHDAVDAVGRALRGAFLDAIDAVRGALDTTVSFLDTKVVPVFETIGRVATTVFGAVLEVLRPIGAFISDNLLPIFAAVAGAVATFASFIAVPLASISGVAATVLGPVIAIGAGVAALGAIFVVAYLKIKPFRDAVDAVARAIVGFGVAAFETARKGIESFLGWFEQNVAPTIAAGVDLAVIVVRRLVDIFNIVREVVTTTARVVAGLLAPAFRFVATIVGDLARFLGAVLLPVFRVIGTVVREVFGVGFQIAGVILRAFGRVVETTFAVIRDVVVFAFRIVKATVESALRVLRGIFQVFAGLLSGNWGKLWDGVKNIVAGVGTYLVKVLEAGFKLILRLVPDLLGGLVGLIGTVLDGVVGIFLDLPARIGRVLLSLGRVIGTILVEALKLAGRLALAGLKFIGDAFLGLPKLIAKTLVGLGGALLDAFLAAGKFVVDKGPDIIATVLGFLGDLAGKVGGFLLDLGGALFDAILAAARFVVTKGPDLIGTLLGFLGQVAGKVGGLLLDLGGALFDAVIAAARFVTGRGPQLIGELLGFLANAAGAVGGFLLDLGGKLLDAILSALVFIGTKELELIGKLLGFIGGFVKAIPGALVDLGQTLFDAINTGITFVTGLLGSALDAVVDYFTKLPGRFVEGLGIVGAKVWESLGASFEFVKSLLGTAIDGLVQFFTDLPSKIGKVLEGVADFVLAPFRLAFKGIATLWNDTIGALDFTLPDFLPSALGGGKGFKAPRINIAGLAEGGIVRPTPGGTLVRVAEAGKSEVISPLDKLQAIIAAAQQPAGPLIGGDVIVQGQAQPEQTAIHLTRELAGLRYRLGG